MSVSNQLNQKKTITMKTFILTTIVTLCSTLVSAKTINNVADDDRSKIANEVIALVMNQELFNEMNYTGELTISFTIDEYEQIHVVDVITNNNSLESHVRRTLENVKVVAAESLVGRTFALAIELVQ
jgi:hypothetical protein